MTAGGPSDRMRAPVEAVELDDHLDRLLAAGDRGAEAVPVDAALDPALLSELARVDAELRHAVMRSGDADTIERWCSTGSGADDQPAAELLVSLLDADDPRRAPALARVRRLRRPT